MFWSNINQEVYIAVKARFTTDERAKDAHIVGAMPGRQLEDLLSLLW